MKNFLRGFLFTAGLLIFYGCSSIVHVDKESGWPWGPDVYTITDGQNTRSLYAGDCLKDKQAADTLAARINRKELSWPVSIQRWDSLVIKVCEELNRY